MNKILNVLFGILMVFSLATAVSATMPRHDPDPVQGMIVSDADTIAQVGQMVSDADTEYNVTVISRNTQVPRDFKGRFYLESYDAYVPINGVLTTSESDVTIVYVPDAGFSADGMIVIGDATIVSQYNDRVEINLFGDATVQAGYTDIEAPTVSTQGGTYWSYGGPMYVTITATAADNDAVRAVRLTIDGIDYDMTETTPGNWEYSLYAAPGSHPYSVTAEDWSGLTMTDISSVAVNTVTIGDTTPPVITNIAPSSVNAGSNNQATFMITADVTDDKGVSVATMKVDGIWYTMSLQSGNTYGATVTLSPGTYIVDVKVGDTSGNAATASATITVNPYTAPSTGGNTGSTGGSSSRRHNGPVRGIWTPVQPTAPVASSNGGIVEQPQEVVPVEPAPVEPKPAEIMQPEPKKSFWNIFKVAAFNVLLLTLILLAILVFR